MKRYYADILEPMATLGKEPLWFDEYAVPRFCEFSPSRCANIYAKEAALVLIECLACEREFPVAFSESSDSEVRAMLMKVAHQSLEARIKSGAIHYGDPPNVGCCPAGPTMDSVPKRVIQYWRRAVMPWDWQRLVELEVAIDCGWNDDEDETEEVSTTAPKGDKF